MVYDLLSNTMTLTLTLALFSSLGVTQVVAGILSMGTSRPSQFRSYSPGVADHQFQAWNNWLPSRSSYSAITQDRPRLTGRAFSFRPWRSVRSLGRQVGKRDLNTPDSGYGTFGSGRNNGFQDWSQWTGMLSAQGPQRSNFRDSFLVGKRLLPNGFQMSSLGNKLEYHPFGGQSLGASAFVGSPGRSGFQSWNGFTKRKQFGSKSFVAGETPFGYRKIVMDWLNRTPSQHNGKAFGSNFQILKRLGKIGEAKDGEIAEDESGEMDSTIKH